MGPSLGFACGYCAEDLDDDGLFPEERAQAELLYGYQWALG